MVLGTRSLTRKEEARLCWEKTFSPLAETDTTIFRLELSPLSTVPEHKTWAERRLLIKLPT